MIRRPQIGLYVCAEFRIKYQSNMSWAATVDRTPAVVESALPDSFEPADINRPLTFEGDL